MKILNVALAAAIVVVVYLRADVFVSIFRMTGIGHPASAETKTAEEEYIGPRKSVVTVFHIADDAASKIRRHFLETRIVEKPQPQPAGRRQKKIILSGSGTYHHHTLEFLKNIRPAVETLYLIDAHSDTRKSDRADCGTWVARAGIKTIFLGGYFGLAREGSRWLDINLVGVGALDVYSKRKGRAYFKVRRATAKNTGGALPATADLRGKVKWLKEDGIASFFGKPGVWVKWKSLDDFKNEARAVTEHRGSKRGGIAAAKTTRKTKAYLTIDLDVLSEKYIDTDWGNGNLSLDELLSLIDIAAERSEIVGADICGWSGKNETRSIGTIERVYSKIVSAM